MTRTLIKQKDAEQICKRAFCLKSEYSKAYLTDFENVYFADGTISYDPAKNEFHHEYIWRNNTSWVLFLTEEKPDIPAWVDIDLAKEVASTAYGNKNSLKTGRIGRYIIPGSFTNYATCERDAYWSARSNWTPLDKIKIDNGITLEYANKNYDHPIQLWSDGSLTTCFPGEEKTGYISKSVDTLLKYAINHPKSKWRNNKKWRELLSFTGDIGEFTEIINKHEQYIDGHHNENISLARAGNYLLVCHSWGGMYGGEGDAGDNLLLLDPEDDIYKKYVLLITEKRKEIQS